MFAAGLATSRAETVLTAVGVMDSKLLPIRTTSSTYTKSTVIYLFENLEH